MIKDVIFYTILRPLIRRNLRERALGLKPDEWYWADQLAIEWGYINKVNYDERA